MPCVDRHDAECGRELVAVTDVALTFDCAGERLVGVISQAGMRARTGVVIVVGGPQYRVGSHRQFVLLARSLAAAGIPVMRFDYRGMGDSSGAMRSFESVSADIRAAIDAFANAAGVERVVLWGLCDAASAMLLYWNTQRDQRLAGMVLLNPWVRSEATLARTHIKHYYGRRLLSRDFWGSLIGGKVDVVGTLRAFATALTIGWTRRTEAGRGTSTFQDAMAAALRSFRGPVLLVLSGNDLTAREFLEYSNVRGSWSGVLTDSRIEQSRLEDADHTFSSQALRERVEVLTLSWYRRHFGAEQA
jgi:exosortase A-associated hydrolase 1